MGYNNDGPTTEIREQTQRVQGAELLVLDNDAESLAIHFVGTGVIFTLPDGWTQRLRNKEYLQADGWDEALRHTGDEE